MKVTVGCCGYPVSKRQYYEKLTAVELQTVFYRVIRESTLQRWKREAPPNFTFTMKAFQGVSHPKESPTWRRSNVKPRDGHGLLKSTAEVKESWEVTMSACRALSARVVVVQTPPAFRDIPANVQAAIRFFGDVERDSAIIG
ncbi:MAG: DUF72 domain-containing protein, partial [Thaumarchaeota archaeon]|nr:DUF72 domain-containing protein [Candidatus Calditenuaceae archaeon]